MNEIDEPQELTRGKRLACNISAAGIMILAGVFLLLCGVGAFPFSVVKALCGTLLAAVGLMFLVNALVTHNSVSLWLSLCFLVPALVELLVKVTAAGYSDLYPLYIAVPAVASLCTMLFTHEWGMHLPVIALFGVPAAVFALKTGGVVSWSVAIAVLVIYVGLLMLILALKGRKEKEDE